MRARINAFATQETSRDDQAAHTGRLGPPGEAAKECCCDAGHGVWLHMMAGMRALTTATMLCANVIVIFRFVSQERD